MKCTQCGADLTPNAAFCKSCGAKSGPAPAAPTPQGLAAVFARDKYFFNQKMFSIREMYSVFDEQGSQILFVRRVFLALKRNIYIYTDKSQQDNILTILQEHFFQIFSKWFTLVDQHQQPLFRFRRRNILSILRRTWDVFDTAGNILGTVAEDSWFKALLRRVMPGGEFLKTDFIFEFGGREVGKFVRKWTIGDKYVLDLSQDPERTVDRRLAVAMAVLLDTAEAR